MWVYFKVPEARYLEYMADLNQHKDDLKIELMLANGSKFEQIGKIGAIEADFNNENGNIAFRADFPNPERLLRHGQTGTVLISRVQTMLVIPQRAVFSSAKRYVYTVDSERWPISARSVQNELRISRHQEEVGVDERSFSRGFDRFAATRSNTRIVPPSRLPQT